MKDGNKIRGKVGKGRIVGDVSGDPNEKGMSKEEVEAYRAGKRRDGLCCLIAQYTLPVVLEKSRFYQIVLGSS